MKKTKTKEKVSKTVSKASKVMRRVPTFLWIILALCAVLVLIAFFAPGPKDVPQSRGCFGANGACAI
ncbi:MAG TPA: hypothetical protein PLX55_02130 [bacterium]|nr:hypothetical protein [bacterium]